MLFVKNKIHHPKGEHVMTTAEEIVMTTDENTDAEIVEQNGHLGIVDFAQQILSEHDAVQSKDNPALIELRIIEERLQLGRRHPDMIRASELDTTNPELADELTKEFLRIYCREEFKETSQRSRSS